MFGRQKDSFEGPISIRENRHDLQKDGAVCHGVFIRAPGISKVLSSDVKILACLSDEDTVVVAVQHKNIIATCFHPELTDDLRWHRYFLTCVINQKSVNSDN